MFKYQLLDWIITYYLLFAIYYKFITKLINQLGILMYECISILIIVTVDLILYTY